MAKSVTHCNMSRRGGGNKLNAIFYYLKPRKFNLV